MTDGASLGPAGLADLLAATTPVIAAEMAALADASGWRPAAGEWSANECVGHLIEAERRGFAGRIRHILAEDRPRLETWDQPAVAAARHDERRLGGELVAEFIALRAGSLELVRSLSATDLARVGRHPQVGDLRVDELLAEWVHHDRNHVRQVLAVTQTRVWDQMGNARRFSLEEA